MSCSFLYTEIYGVKECMGPIARCLAVDIYFFLVNSTSLIFLV